MAIFSILVYVQVGTAMSEWGYSGTESDSLSFPLTALVIPIFSQCPHIHMHPTAQLDHCYENLLISPTLLPQTGGLAPLSIFPFSLLSLREGFLKTHLRTHHCYTSAFPLHLNVSPIWLSLPFLALDRLKHLKFSGLQRGNISHVHYHRFCS